MRRHLIAVAALTVLSLFASEAAAQSCTTPKPGADWVCVGQGWLPPGHPGIPTTPVAPPAPLPQPDKAFLLGHRYVRDTTDVRIVGTGQVDGFPVLFALCGQEGDGCFYTGAVRMFLGNATAAGWTDQGPY